MYGNTSTFKHFRGGEGYSAVEVLPTEGKILTYQRAIQTIRSVRERGLRSILVQGTYDLNHLEPVMYATHIAQLWKTKRLADVLFVGLENDETLLLNRREEYTAPLRERLGLVAQRGEVDFVFGFDDVISYGVSHEQYVRRYTELFPDFLSVSLSGTNIEAKIKEAEEAGIIVVLVEDRAS